MVADTEASRDTRPHLNPLIHDRPEGGGGWGEGREENGSRHRSIERHKAPPEIL